MTYYKSYVEDVVFHEKYVAYQTRYRDNVRESDKVLCRLLHERLQGVEKARILDIGCSNGNLLRYLRAELPQHVYCGGDLSQVAIDACLADASLNGIDFTVTDALEIGRPEAFDVIIANAVLYMFAEREYRKCLSSVYQALRPGGMFMMFDFAHPYNQLLCIKEYSASHAEGLSLYFRPMRAVREDLEKAGFIDVLIQPFDIPIDLVSVKQAEAGSFQDLCTYTVKVEDGRRLLFRGALYQPWCHMIGRKKARA